jgi:hypothetical protein
MSSPAVVVSSRYTDNLPKPEPKGRSDPKLELTNEERATRGATYYDNNINKTNKPPYPKP